VELIVAALVLLGFVAIITRFITRDEAGQLRLPRVVDDSIGMWALRRITGRRLWERPWDDEQPDQIEFDAGFSDPTRAALGAMARANAADSMPGPTKVVPARYVAARHRKREIVASPTPVLDLRRRTEAQQRRSRRLPWRAIVVSAGAVLIVGAIIIGLSIGRGALTGAVLSATGRPSAAFESQRSDTPLTTSSPMVMAPTATITRLAKSSVPGHSVLRLTLSWTVSDHGSGIETQLLEWRTDDGPWTAIRLSSASARTASVLVPRGHLYVFRVRATDRSGNVGLFVSRSIRT
jgi:hypothetical protein